MSTIPILNGDKLPIHLPDEMIESIIRHMSLRTLCASIQSLELFENYFLRNVARLVNDYNLTDYGFDVNNNTPIDHFVYVAGGHWEWLLE